ncbi:MAG TPA: hypothetical protein OIM59_12690 [Bacteroides mediterraneensis]|uniref:hypothetical protein n=1 Tax=Bacteroides mediterraneensis TaxID=1841856 RepID=UPI0026E96F14|nr:hypothetical protein [Bacteroides mediterraneensis]HJH65463.1 hypothetical protein [Bacteroides mediterraneensis]
MKNQKQKEYETPQTTFVEVELEQGFMNASIFDEKNQQDDGVNITGHEVGNTGDYTTIGWDVTGNTESTWNN